MQRRSFLKRGLLGGGLLALGGVGALAVYPSRVKYAPTQPLKALDPRTFNIMASIAARVVTAEGADPVAITHTVDQSLGRAVPEAQNDIVTVLKLFENGVTELFLAGRMGPFTQLDAASQDRVLLAWRDSRVTLFRGAYRALKNLCVTSFYRKESSWRLVGYPGPPQALLALSAAGGVNGGGTP